MEESHNPRHNRLLACLPDADWKHWEPQLELVEMPLGVALHESGAPQTSVYFPTTAIVSQLYVLDGGSSAAIAVAGLEGLVGLSALMGGSSTPGHAMVQSAGMGYRMRAAAFKGAVERSLPVVHLMLRYTQALVAQMSQTAACNRHHPLEMQFGRWLLLSLDRLHGNEVVMTQELISNMLGVRREGVTEAALHLQAAGIIRYARGHIWVLDRPMLEQRTCECYQVVKQEYDRLLPYRETT